MINLYKKYIKEETNVNLKHFDIPYFNTSEIELKYWHKPYGDNENDIYNENALRSSTLKEKIKSKGWYGLVIKNVNGNWEDNSITNIHHDYLTKKNLISTYKKFKGKWTKISEILPEVKDYIEKNVEKYLYIGHVYILKIEPHGFIKEHRDIPDQYDENIHTNYNILNTFMAPINDTNGSYFILNKKQVEMEKGKVTWFNSSLPHLYFNMSNDCKYMLLFTGLARKNWIQMTVSDML